ncbi:MAG: hypothetical protein J2P57_13095 [Acidimicrobiaceae bacterium]|nr:hypothetical protein [Acidimicrobiaceae bacterium]
MGAAAALIVIGILLWLLVWPIAGIVLVALGVLWIIWAMFMLGGPAGRRRWWY